MARVHWKDLPCYFQDEKPFSPEQLLEGLESIIEEWRKEENTDVSVKSRESFIMVRIERALRENIFPAEMHNRLFDLLIEYVQLGGDKSGSIIAIQILQTSAIKVA